MQSLEQTKLDLLVALITTRAHIDEIGTGQEVISCRLWKGIGTCGVCPFGVIGTCLLNIIVSEKTDLNVLNTLIQEIKTTAETESLTGQFLVEYNNRSVNNNYDPNKCISDFKHVYQELPEAYKTSPKKQEPTTDRFSDIEMVNDYD